MLRGSFAEGKLTGMQFQAASIVKHALVIFGIVVDIRLKSFQQRMTLLANATTKVTEPYKHQENMIIGEWVTGCAGYSLDTAFFR